MAEGHVHIVTVQHHADQGSSDKEEIKLKSIPEDVRKPDDAPSPKSDGDDKSPEGAPLPKSDDDDKIPEGASSPKSDDDDKIPEGASSPKSDDDGTNPEGASSPKSEDVDRRPDDGPSTSQGPPRGRYVKKEQKLATLSPHGEIYTKKQKSTGKSPQRGTKKQKPTSQSPHRGTKKKPTNQALEDADQIELVEIIKDDQGSPRREDESSGGAHEDTENQSQEQGARDRRRSSSRTRRDEEAADPHLHPEARGRESGCSTGLIRVWIRKCYGWLTLGMTCLVASIVACALEPVYAIFKDGYVTPAALFMIGCSLLLSPFCKLWALRKHGWRR